MRFFIYHRPLLSIRKKEFLGTLVHVSLEEKEFSPDGETWKVRRCIRSESVYNRLTAMLRLGGMAGDDIFPLSDQRKLPDLVNYMTRWERK